jgi:hypothetical protein
MTVATIQGDVLEWALEDSGVNRDEVLEAVGLTLRAAQSVHLSGPLTIDQEQLKYLAKVTHRSPYFFALPAPPASSRHSVDANFTSLLFRRPRQAAVTRWTPTSVRPCPTWAKREPLIQMNVQRLEMRNDANRPPQK